MAERIAQFNNEERNAPVCDNCFNRARGQLDGVYILGGPYMDCKVKGEATHYRDTCDNFLNHCRPYETSKNRDNESGRK
jgi:hypothetical protein